MQRAYSKTMLPRAAEECWRTSLNPVLGFRFVRLRCVLDKFTVQDGEGFIPVIQSVELWLLHMDLHVVHLIDLDTVHCIASIYKVGSSLYVSAGCTIVHCSLQPANYYGRAHLGK